MAQSRLCNTTQHNTPKCNGNNFDALRLHGSSNACLWRHHNFLSDKLKIPFHQPTLIICKLFTCFRTKFCSNENSVEFKVIYIVVYWELCYYSKKESARKIIITITKRRIGKENILICFDFNASYCKMQTIYARAKKEWEREREMKWERSWAWASKKQFFFVRQVAEVGILFGHLSWRSCRIQNNDQTRKIEPSIRRFVSCPFFVATATGRKFLLQVFKLFWLTWQTVVSIPHQNRRFNHFPLSHLSW